MDTSNVDVGGEQYQWGFTLVSIWSSHLDSSSNVMWDISPASIGNIQSYPTEFVDYPAFYNTIDGGDASIGHALNPHTGQPYDPQIVLVVTMEEFLQNSGQMDLILRLLQDTGSLF